MSIKHNCSLDFKIKEVLSTFKTLPRIFSLLWNVEKKYLIIIITLNILIGLIPVLSLLSLQYLVNALLISNIINKKIMLLLASFIIINFTSNIASLANMYFKNLFSSLLTKEVQIDIMSKASDLSLENFEDSVIYDKLQRAKSEAEYRPFEIFTSILSIISGIVTLISSCIVLFYWKWWTVFLLILVPSLSTVRLIKQGQAEYMVQKNRTPLTRKRWYYNYLLTKDITFKEIKFYSLSNHFLDKYKDLSSRFYNEDKKLLISRCKLTLFFDFINLLSISFINILIILSALAKEILIGNLFTYFRAVTLTQSSSMSILNMLFKLYQNNLFINNLFEFLDLDSDISKSLEDGVKLNKTKLKLNTIDRIEFKNVSFKYPNSENYALKNVSFVLTKGETIALVGENGSGKTTLIKLLIGLYSLSSGSIMINDKNICEYDIESLRNCISVVFQDFIKYELTARENIAFGSLKYFEDTDKIIDLSKKCGIYECINSLPNKLDNQLGVWFANGVQLSGGQWQKIALSRAFIRDSQLFILDEPTAALDPISEKKIFEKFFELSENKIGIFTSHRFSSVKFANKIYVFKDGQVIEFGSHEQLMGLAGYYSTLYNTQASPFWENNSLSK